MQSVTIKIENRKQKGGNKMLNSIKAYFRTKVSSKSGQGMVEYGLIIAVIAIVVLVALTPVGTALSTVFTNITTSISGV